MPRNLPVFEPACVLDVLHVSPTSACTVSRGPLRERTVMTATYRYRCGLFCNAALQDDTKHQTSGSATNCLGCHLQAQGAANVILLPSHASLNGHMGGNHSAVLLLQLSAWVVCQTWADRPAH